MRSHFTHYHPAALLKSRYFRHRTSLIPYLNAVGDPILINDLPSGGFNLSSLSFTVKAFFWDLRVGCSDRQIQSAAISRPLIEISIKTSAALYQCLRLFWCGHKPLWYRSYYAPTGLALQKVVYYPPPSMRGNALTSDKKI